MDPLIVPGGLVAGMLNLGVTALPDLYLSFLQIILVFMSLLGLPRQPGVMTPDISAENLVKSDRRWLKFYNYFNKAESSFASAFFAFGFIVSLVLLFLFYWPVHIAIVLLYLFVSLNRPIFRRTSI